MDRKRKIGRGRGKRGAQEREQYITVLEKHFAIQKNTLFQKKVELLNKIEEVHAIRLVPIPEDLKTTKLKDARVDSCQLQVMTEKELYKGSTTGSARGSLTLSVDKVYPAYLSCGNSSKEGTRSNIFKTPINCIANNQMITPKFKPGILRVPECDELAVSATGSPLLVSTSTRDDTVNVNVPLRNGQKILIMPNPDVDTSGIRENLDPSVKQQLRQLMNTIHGLVQN